VQGYPLQQDGPSETGEAETESAQQHSTAPLATDRQSPKARLMDEHAPVPRAPRDAQLAEVDFDAIPVWDAGLSPAPANPSPSCQPDEVGRKFGGGRRQCPQSRAELALAKGFLRNTSGLLRQNRCVHDHRELRSSHPPSSRSDSATAL
jgi:hypothetical protein